METLVAFCNRLRAELETIKKEVGAARLNAPADKAGEVEANYTLAYRHLEDARMRLGKVIQADGDGVSKYDKPQSESLGPPPAQQG